MDLGARVVVIDNCQKVAVKVVADLANKWLRVLKEHGKSQIGSASKETLSQMQEDVELSRMQIKNQERIISLLEEIRDNTTSNSVK